MKNVLKLTIGIVLITFMFANVGWSQLGVDIVLIIDSSGSMSSNDTNNLRISAAQQFITLAGSDVESNVQIAIVDFDGSARILASLTVADDTVADDAVDGVTGKDQLTTAVNRIDSSGGTNIAAGLQVGYNALSDPNSPNVRKAAVLLTDGEDSSNTSQIVTNYADQGWSIYTIGLGTGVNDQKLIGIANATPEGEYFPVNLQRIQEIYNIILAKVTRKSVLSSLRGFLNQDQQVTKNVFIDSSIGQVGFSASWIGSTIEMVLVDPSGAEITPDLAESLGIDYQVAPTFAIYTVDAPMEGEWKMNLKGTDIPPEGEPYSLVVTGTSDVVTNFLAFDASYAIGSTIRIGLRIQEKTGDTVQPILDAMTSADIVRPDGHIETVNLFDDGIHNDHKAGDGIYASNYTNVDVLGTYLIRASAENGFSRKIEQQIVVGNINDVFIDGSTLVPAPGTIIDRPPKTISAVISGPAGQINIDSIVLKIDGTTVAHTYQAVNQLVSFESAHLSYGDHTVSLSVNDTVETEWEFNIGFGVVSNFDVILAKGLNMISVPLMPEVPYTARTLGEMLGATTVIRLNAETQTYFAYVVTDITDGFTIEGGKGYIVNVPTASTVTFTGKLWQNDPMPAAPLRESEFPPTVANTWAFVISSDLRGQDPNTRYTLIAKNLRTGAQAAQAISDDTQNLKAVWADLNRTSVVEVGDTLEITLQDSDGTIVAGPIQQTVSNADIHNAYMKVALTVGDVQPISTLLAQNYPNPFNPETWIPYQLSESTDVDIEIYDSSGNLVRTLNIGLKSAGVYMDRTRAAYWDGKNEMGERVASGIYFYTLRTPEFSATRRMVILK